MPELTWSLLIKCLGDRRGILGYVHELEYQLYNYMMERQTPRIVI